LFTGASSGIGLASAKLFSEHGARVMSADLNPPPEDIPNVIFRKVDLTQWDEQYDLFEWTANKYGRIDIAFLNAGVGEIENVFVDKLDNNGRLKEPAHSVLAVNLIAPINGFKIAVHFMKKQMEPGSVVITGSGKST
jgi:NAD(P)-dependent dehydrogenase (short-subunit alcohol dehydrogenase family)